MSRALIIPFILVLLVGGTSQSFATNTPTIELEKTVHFLTPGGEDVVVEPGTYEVEAADEWLRLIPQRGHRIDAILMNAQVGKHEEVIKSPHAKSEQRGEDQHLVALMLPNGTTLEAVGYENQQLRSDDPISKSYRPISLLKKWGLTLVWLP
jgi:hypothetical protein